MKVLKVEEPKLTPAADAASLKVAVSRRSLRYLKPCSMRLQSALSTSTSPVAPEPVLRRRAWSPHTNRSENLNLLCSRYLPCASLPHLYLPTINDAVSLTGFKPLHFNFWSLPAFFLNLSSASFSRTCFLKSAGSYFQR